MTGSETDGMSRRAFGNGRQTNEEESMIFPRQTNDVLVNSGRSTGMAAYQWFNNSNILVEVEDFSGRESRTVLLGFVGVRAEDQSTTPGNIIPSDGIPSDGYRR